MASTYVDDNDNFGHSDKIDLTRTNQIMLISQAGQQSTGNLHEWVAALKNIQLDGVVGNNLEKEEKNCNSFVDQGIEVKSNMTKICSTSEYIH